MHYYIIFCHINNKKALENASNMKVVAVYVMVEKGWGILRVENKGAFHGNLKSNEVHISPTFSKSF